MEITKVAVIGAGIEAITDASEQVDCNRPQLSTPGRPVFEEMIKWLNEGCARGLFMPQDVNIGTEMACIVTSGDIDPGTRWGEQDFFDVERRSFLSLVSIEATRARINSMLDEGSPVRN